MPGRSLQRLYIQPLFMHALSGEFTPLRDPEHQHTAGKLLVASYLDGEISVRREIEHRLINHVGGSTHVTRYRPSWQQEVEVSAFYRGAADGHWAAGLIVSQDVDFVAITIDHNGKQLRLTTPRIGTEVTGVGLNPELGQLRHHVTETFQGFFDQAEV